MLYYNDTTLVGELIDLLLPAAGNIVIAGKLAPRDTVFLSYNPQQQGCIHYVPQRDPLAMACLALIYVSENTV